MKILPFALAFISPFALAQQASFTISWTEVAQNIVSHKLQTQTEGQAWSAPVTFDTTNPYTYVWPYAIGESVSLAALRLQSCRVDSCSDYTPQVTFPLISTIFMSPFLESGGEVSIETDHPHTVAAVDHHNWAFSTDANASGGAAMITNPVDANQYVYADAPRLGYQFKIITAGTYYLWARLSGPTASTNSVNLALDGTTQFTNITVPAGGYAWTNQANSVVMSATLTAGDHLVEVYQRESGTPVDKIYLVNSSSTTPTGNGPNESSRDLPPPAAPTTVKIQLVF